MTDTLHRYYRPSAAAPISGIFTLMTVGVLAAAVAGTIYAALARYNPLIYFTFIGACFCGGAVGLALQYGARVGRVRNRMVVWGVSAFVGLLTVYFSWVAYIYLLSDLLTFQPQIVWQIVQLLAQNGVWEIRGSTPTGGALYAIWAIEAALIGGITMLMGSSTVVPFCESCQLWTEPQILETQVPLENAADFAQAMENEQYSALYELSGGNVNEDDCVHLKAHCCPNCHDSNHMTATRITKSVNDKGEESTSETTLFEHMIVPHEVVDGLRTRPQTAAVVDAPPVDAAADESQPTA